MLKTDDTNLERLAEPSELCLGVMDGCGTDQKLELVVCEKQPDDTRFELRLVAWADGIGWYRQQTLVLPRELAALDGLIRRARRLTSRRLPRHQIRGKVLAFPLMPTRRAPIKP